MTMHDDIAIRTATDSDQAALQRLAALDSGTVPSGRVLIAEVGGEPQAARSISGGATIADPFRRTRHLVRMLAVAG